MSLFLLKSLQILHTIFKNMALLAHNKKLMTKKKFFTTPVTSRGSFKGKPAMIRRNICAQFVAFTRWRDSGLLTKPRPLFRHAGFIITALLMNGYVGVEDEPMIWRQWEQTQGSTKRKGMKKSKRSRSPTFVFRNDAIVVITHYYGSCVNFNGSL